ncbi:MAG: hypothetical protein VX830_09585 [Candidatus Poribacteria bacterium]|nr:hypothetical protein [Candidatus Poribacteria bacterium]
MIQTHEYSKIRRSKWFLFLFAFLQFAFATFASNDETLNPVEHTKLTSHSQLHCRFLTNDLVITLAYTVDSYLLFDWQYDLVTTKIENITQNGRKLAPETYANFDDLEGQFMLANQLENGTLSHLSPTETAWAFSSTATSLKTSLDFMFAHHHFDDPSIGQWEVSQTGSVNGWIRGPDWSQMTIKMGQVLVNEIELQLSATLPNMTDNQPSSDEALLLMDELWFSDQSDSELEEEKKYQLEVIYRSELVSQTVLTEKSATITQDLLQKFEEAKQMLMDDEVIPVDLLSDSTRPSVDEKLVNDLKQILVNARSRKNQMAKFWSITEKLLKQSQPKNENKPPLSDFSVQPLKGENDVILNWQPDTNGQGYQVLANGKVIDHLNSADLTEYIHYDCPPDTEITYQVRLINNLSVTTDFVKILVEADNTVPENPESITEEILFTDDESAINISHRHLKWEPSPSGDVVSYRIRKGEEVIVTLPADIIQYTDTNGDFSKGYTIYAVDDVGNWSSGARSHSRDFGRMFGQLNQYSSSGELGKLVVLAERIKNTMMFSRINDYVTNLMVESFSEYEALPKLASFYSSILQTTNGMSKESVKSYQKLLASVYLASKQPKSAVRIYQQLIERSGGEEQLELTASLARAYRQSGDSQQVITLLEQIIDSSPDRYDFYRDLGYTYDDLNQPLKVINIANRLQERLNDLDKSDTRDRRQFYSDGADIFSVLGTLYELSGNYPSAVRLYKRGIYEANNRSLLSSLADTYELMGEIETADQIRKSKEIEENTSGDWRSERQRGGRQQSSTRGIPSTPMIDIGSNEIFLSDYQDKILILHFFVPTSDLANLQTLSKFAQNRKGSLQVIAITSDHLGKLTVDPASVDFPLVQLNQADWDLFEFGFGSQIKLFPTTLTVIGDGLFLSEQHHDQLSDTVLLRLFNRAKERRSRMHREPNILWADKVLKFSSQYGEVDWSAEQILGEPDTYPAHGDRPTAWSPSISRKTPTEFVRVGFANPTYMEGLKIYETCNPGAINQVFAIDQNGVRHMVWQNDIPEITILKRRIFRLNMPATSYKISSIEIHLIPSSDGSLNQIDAIGLIYPQD